VSYVAPPYAASQPPARPSSAELRARIPGWGADLDPRDRPAVPQEIDPGATGAHWDLPERQTELRPRERSIEHLMLPPVFGTSSPTHGVSGAMRRYAYARFSEARAAHWLILLAADRADSLGSSIRSLATLHPDNPVVETGIMSEYRHHPIASRLGQRRADVRHTWVDPLIIATPWVLRGAAVYLAVRTAARRIRQRS
jgi:hypothetical protein